MADYVRDIKTATSIWLKQGDDFPNFDGWADGYAALTCGWRDRDNLINYIKKQQEHHRRYSFEEEVRVLLETDR